MFSKLRRQHISVRQGRNSAAFGYSNNDREIA